jgi:hypothetical protein
VQSDAISQAMKDDIQLQDILLVEWNSAVIPFTWEDYGLYFAHAARRLQKAHYCKYDTSKTDVDEHYWKIKGPFPFAPTDNLQEDGAVVEVEGWLGAD